MQGYDIYKRICVLLGYNTENGELSDTRAGRMTDIINQISQDLRIEPIESLSQQMTVEPKKAEALVYGCAMMLAVSEGDASKASVYSQLYNAKRMSALCQKDIVEDTLPTNTDGGI